MRDAPDQTAAKAGTARRLLPGACPNCGEGDLFAGPFTLTLRPACQRCATCYDFADAGDGPAVFAIFILGIVVLGGALIAEFKLGVAPWVHVVLWGVTTPLLALVLLRWLKSRLIAGQFRTKAGEARAEAPDARPGA